LNFELLKEWFVMAKRLRLIRVYHDTKLMDLAKALDVSPSFLSEVEQAKDAQH